MTTFRNLPIFLLSSKRELFQPAAIIAVKFPSGFFDPLDSKLDDF